MSIHSSDEEKMRNALHLPDAMTKATGSDVEPEHAATLKQRADIREMAEKASADNLDKKAPNDPTD